MIEIKTIEKDDPEEIFAPSVLSYPRIGRSMTLVDADRIISKLPAITITFDYPLSTDVTLEFFRHDKKAFTLRDLFRCVYKGYKQIYKENEGTAKRPEFKSDFFVGKYGIWEHSLGELFFEGYDEPEPGRFVLYIGS